MLKLFKRKDRFIGMHEFRDSRGRTHMIFLTRRKVFEYDPVLKNWTLISLGIAKEVVK